MSRVHRAAICVTAQSADARVDAMTSVWVLAALPTANLIKDGFQFAKLQQLSRGHAAAKHHLDATIYIYNVDKYSS